jgi:hypothetical protein
MGASGVGGLTPNPSATGMISVPLGSVILVPREVAPMAVGDVVLPSVPPGGEVSPAVRPLREFKEVVPRTGPMPRPIPVVPRPAVEL